MAPSGAAGGPGDITYQHLKVALDDVGVAALLHQATERFAQALLPPSSASALMLARLTALSKRDKGVRGLATGNSFRRQALGLIWGLVKSYHSWSPPRIFWKTMMVRHVITQAEGGEEGDP